MLTVNIGLLGLGNVGLGVARYLDEHGSCIGLNLKSYATRTSRNSNIRASYARDAYEVIRDPQVHIVVELIGGESPALDYVMETIKQRKPVVTANKLIIAKHGREIFDAARHNNVDVGFEASVGGGIPIVHTLMSDLTANTIDEITGIVNGTTNYMLTRMERNMSYDDALKEAQREGFAEADSTSDTSGEDSKYKLSILSSLAWNAWIEPSSIRYEGITQITPQDMNYAAEFGYKIKLLATAKMHNGRVEVRVNPALIDNKHPLAAVNDEYNAIHIKGDLCGPQMYYGKGAGRGPTTSAVVANIRRIAKNIETGMPNDLPLLDRPVTLVEDPVSAGYIRVDLRHVVGALHAVSGILARNNISVKDSIQREKFGYRIDGDTVIPDIITTEPVRDSFVRKALEELAESPMVHGRPYYLRIEA